MRVTMDDIARMAGVSKATVSRVVNEIPEGVGPETRARVLKIIEDTNYRAVNFPKQMQRSKTLGLIISERPLMVVSMLFSTAVQSMASIDPSE